MPTIFSKKQLFDYGKPQKLTESNLNCVAFPLGGIGTGSVSLGGWGQLRDWEVQNRPAKGQTWNDTFFTLKINVGEPVPVVKVLQGPPRGDFGFHGHTAPNTTGEPLPHFRHCAFEGSFPCARVTLQDERVPLEADLEAFNPFIPLNDKDSSIPVAILRYHLKNASARKISGTIYGNLRNRIGVKQDKSFSPRRINAIRSGDGLTGLWLAVENIDPASPCYGNMSLATPWPDADVCPRWKEDSLLKFWDMVTGSEPLPKQGNADIGTVAARFALAPGAAVVIPFILTWYFPNFEWYAGPDVCPGEGACAPDTKKATWKNYYATVWPDAWDVAVYTARHLGRLASDTKSFRDALFGSTLPRYVLDAISSQISILKTSTCLRLSNGVFYGFEGCSDGGGCCAGSCTHVWNYAQALPYLFPALQRSMRWADYSYAMRADGCVQFRVPLPLGAKADWKFLPAADGQMGTVIQIYREWLISGDAAWLKTMWPLTKKALEFAWQYWDPNKDGVMEGVQHNTYDIEYYGPNPLSGVMYLGALRAAEEMAKVMGEPAKAQEYHALFERGSQWIDRNLFNGEYYEQRVNPRAIDLIPDSDPVKACAKKRGRDDKFPDWPQWQMGQGCLADQLMGQWYARLLGLGSLLNEKNVRQAAQSIFNYNWQSDFTDHATLSAPRIYAANNEQGLLLCTWPKGGRPGFPSLYADEVWTGVEYEVAAALIYEGLLDEGLSIVRGARGRYNGKNRNPWNEIECGHHYARAMSSYALLPALSGFSYSAAEKRLGFAPKVSDQQFSAFFSVGSGWGTYRQKTAGRRLTVEIKVAYGQLELAILSLRVRRQVQQAAATCAGRKLKVVCRQNGNEAALDFVRPVQIGRSETLKCRLA